jgi:hypothetical protein
MAVLEISLEWRSATQKNKIGGQLANAREASLNSWVDPDKEDGNGNKHEAGMERRASGRR